MWPIRPNLHLGDRDDARDRPYDVKAPTAPVLPGRPPFAFHFYPGSRKIVIFGVDTARSRTAPTYRPPPRPGTARRVQPNHTSVRSLEPARRP